ncbi:MAG: PhoPQ-activated pathogenicity-related family protein [Acidobacteria bacterium]|nr:PhoPQ-activated pathogenicity-related family protein [Acidobacteriota bacterium]
MDRAFPLAAYVEAPDPAYSYGPAGALEGEGFTAHFLEMTSQSWRTAAEVDRPVWRHWLTVIEPEAVVSDIALLRIGSGRNGDPQPEKPNPVLARIAVATGTVVAEIRMVPNQPLTFAGDGSGPRTEDALIAFAWDRFLRGGDAGWLPRLPMTKSAVRAMDTVTAFLAESGRHRPRIRRFVVTGASKRGWTTWTTAAVDSRVVAIVPMVIDLLNLEESFRHHYGAYGFWAPAIQEYVDMGIPDWFGTERMTELRRIVDPYEFRERLPMPKLLIHAAGDEFFLPDSSRFYFSDLPGEKHLRCVPNADHSLGDTDAAETLLAFYRSIVAGAPRPEFSWSFEPDGSIRVRPRGSARPAGVRLWQATNHRARDFRLESIGEAWTAAPLLPEPDGSYAGRVPEPEAGFTAFFVELTYPGEGEGMLKLTTEVRVVPDILPFSFPP